MQNVTIPRFLHVFLSAFRQSYMQKGHDKHSLKAVCHALTRGSSFSPIQVDTGSFPACYTALWQRVRRLDYVRNIVDYSFVKLIKNFWEHFGHFRIIRLLFFIDASPVTAIAIAFSPTGLSHNLPRLHAGHLTKLLCIVSCSKICSIKSISSTLLSMLHKTKKTGRNE